VVTRRAAALQAAGPTVEGHRLLVRCHLFAQRWPLAVEEVRRMVALDPGTRAEATGFLAHVVAKAPEAREARFLLASLHAALGAVDPAREALAGATPRSEEVFEAHRRLVAAYPAHRGARLDLLDALVAERRLDEALEEAARVRREAGGPGPDLVERIDRVLSLSPEYAPALYALADEHHAAGAWSEEIEAHRRILRLAPREAETVLGRLDAILERDPRCHEAAVEVVRLVPRHGKPERAAPEARRALREATTPADAARLAEALRPLEKKLGADPEYREVMAAALSRGGKTRPAVEAWDSLLADAPDRAAAAAKDLAPLAAVPGEDGVEALRVLATARLLEGRPEEACDAAERFLAKRPKEPGAARALFRRILETHASSREAADGCARTAALEGDPAAAVEARLHELRHHPGRRREVGRSLEELRVGFPKEAGIPLALAESVRLPLELDDDAAADLEAALDLDPSCHRKALELSEVILARSPKCVGGARARARALAAAGRFDEAVDGFRALADLDSRRLGDALEGLDGILRDAPSHPAARLRRGEVLRESGKPKEAAKALEALLADTAPRDPAGYRVLGELARAREDLWDFAGALEALRQAGERHPSEPSVAPRIRANHGARLVARAASLRSKTEDGKPGEADLDLAEALLEAGDPKAGPAAAGPEPPPGPALARWRTLRGRALLRAGSALDAVEELEAAVQVEGVEEAATPAARDALYYCGLAHLRTGELLKATRRLEQVARVAPGHRRVRDALDRVYAEDRRRLAVPLTHTSDLESMPREARGA
jgi:tetratricopeptide (TPR) repeat protein